MCACEPGFTCSQCAGTPFDPAYLDNEPLPLSTDDFDRLGTIAEWRADHA